MVVRAPRAFVRLTCPASSNRGRHWTSTRRAKFDLSSGVQPWPPLDKHPESEFDLSSGVQSWPPVDKHPESEFGLSSGVQFWPPVDKHPVSELDCPAASNLGRLWKCIRKANSTCPVASNPGRHWTSTRRARFDLSGGFGPLGKYLQSRETLICRVAHVAVRILDINAPL